ncbi:glycosyltransferase 87 family protein [Streptomycetaceae bacterium NBC_01309]
MPDVSPRRPIRPRAARSTATRRLARAWAVLLGLSLLAYLALAATRPGQMWWLGDLRVYQAGGAAALDGGRGLYDLAVGAARLPFTYTPWAALTFSPLALVPWGAAKPLAVAGNLALLFAAAHLAWGLAGLAPVRARRRAAALTAAVLLWTEPVQETLRFGQVNLLLVTVILYDLSRPRGARFVGVGIGFAAGVKLTPAIFAVYLLATGRWREARTALATFTLTAVAGLVILPEASLRYWSGLFLDSARMGPIGLPGNQSLRGALVRLLGDARPDAAVWVPVTLTVGAAGILLASALYRHFAKIKDEATRRRGELAGVSVTALTGLLVSPVSWSHHWVWIVPGTVLMASAAGGVRRTRLRLPAVLAAACALPLATAAPPAFRVELPRPVPTGIIWHVPYRGGRELRLSGFEQLVANAYVLVGLLMMIMCTVILCRFGTYTWRSRVGGTETGRVDVGRPRGEPAHVPAPRAQSDRDESLPIS